MKNLFFILFALFLCSFCLHLKGKSKKFMKQTPIGFGKPGFKIGQVTSTPSTGTTFGFNTDTENKNENVVKGFGLDINSENNAVEINPDVGKPAMKIGEVPTSTKPTGFGTNTDLKTGFNFPTQKPGFGFNVTEEDLKLPTVEDITTDIDVEKPDMKIGGEIEGPEIEENSDSDSETEIAQQPMIDIENTEQGNGHQNAESTYEETPTEPEPEPIIEQPKIEYETVCKLKGEYSISNAAHPKRYLGTGVLGIISHYLRSQPYLNSEYLYFEPTNVNGQCTFNVWVSILGKDCALVAPFPGRDDGIKCYITDYEQKFGDYIIMKHNDLYQIKNVDENCFIKCGNEKCLCDNVKQPEFGNNEYCFKFTKA